MNENLQERLVEIAKDCIGTPYVWGGISKEGFDCSGLIWYTYNELGVNIPRISQEQFKIGISVEKDELQPGDLVFFCSESKIILEPNHVGMYIGNDKFIEAPHTGENVRISELYNRNDYVGAVRIINNNKILIINESNIKHFLGDAKYTLYQYICELNSDNITFRCGKFAYNKITNFVGFKGDSRSGQLNLNGERIQVILTEELEKKQLIITKHEINENNFALEPIHDDDIILEFA